MAVPVTMTVVPSKAEVVRFLRFALRAGRCGAITSNADRHCTSFLVLFLICLFCLVPAVAGAGPLSLPGITSKKSETPASEQPAPVATTELTDAEIDANRLKLDARIAELRQQSTPEAIAALQATYLEAATPDELSEWEKLINKHAEILEDNSTSLFRYKNYRKDVRNKIEEIKSWQGFAEKPPYPISLVDNLRDNLEAKQNVLRSLDVIRATIEEDFAEYSSSLKNSSKKVRLAEEEVEKNTGKPGELRSKWLLQLAMLRKEVDQAGVVYGEMRRLSVKVMLKKAQSEVDFLSRKIAVAKANYRFSAEELKEKTRSIDEKLNTCKQMLEQSKRYEKTARKQLDAAEAALSRANALLAAGRRPDVPLDRLVREQKRLQILFEDAGVRVLVSSGMAQLLKAEKEVWEQRYLIAGGSDTRDKLAEPGSSRSELDVLGKWKTYVFTKISAIELYIKNLQDALSSETLSAGDREDLRASLSIYQEQENLLQRGVLLINNYEQLVQRRDEEAQKKQLTLEGRAKGVFAAIASLASKIWLTELYVAEETIIVEDRKISRARSVTVGKLVEAVIILLVGIVLIRTMKKPLYWHATRRLKFRPNDAQLYIRLLSYMLFIIVLVSALVFVNIPLAVFTFFGGALAIGIGFGAQTLINNFISGLILMFDRTISVGDVVEVDGHRGRVASIGMRSSSIKRFDGVEMLVPNSVFLQQNVINWTSSDPRTRYTVSVGVAYGSPTREVERVILAAVKEQREVLRDPSPYVVFENFADSSLNFTAYFWLEQNPDINSLEVFSDIRHRIGEMLAAAGIQIPFPQRDLHLSTSGPLEVIVSEPER